MAIKGLFILSIAAASTGIAHADSSGAGQPVQAPVPNTITVYQWTNAAEQKVWLDLQNQVEASRSNWLDNKSKALQAQSRVSSLEQVQQSVDPVSSGTASPEWTRRLDEQQKRIDQLAQELQSKGQAAGKSEPIAQNGNAAVVSNTFVPPQYSVNQIAPRNGQMMAKLLNLNGSPTEVVVGSYLPGSWRVTSISVSGVSIENAAGQKVVLR